MFLTAVREKHAKMNISRTFMIRFALIGNITLGYKTKSINPKSGFPF